MWILGLGIGLVVGFFIMSIGNTVYHGQKVTEVMRDIAAAYFITATVVLVLVFVLSKIVAAVTT